MDLNLFFVLVLLGQINPKCGTWEAPMQLVCEQSCVKANLDLPGLFASVTPADKQDLLIL